MKHTVIEIDDLTKRRPAIVWARETFGTSKPEGVRFCDMRWYQRDVKPDSGGWASRFYFKNPEDATIFALKWL